MQNWAFPRKTRVEEIYHTLEDPEYQCIDVDEDGIIQELEDPKHQCIDVDEDGVVQEIRNISVLMLMRVV